MKKVEKTMFVRRKGQVLAVSKAVVEYNRRKRRERIQRKQDNEQ